MTTTPPNWADALIHEILLNFYALGSFYSVEPVRMIYDVDGGAWSMDLRDTQTVKEAEHFKSVRSQSTAEAFAATLYTRPYRVERVTDKALAYARGIYAARTDWT